MARLPIVLAHPGARASVTATPVSGSSPVFLTVIVKLAVPPLAIVWLSGVLSTSIFGLITFTDALSSSVTVPPSESLPLEVALLTVSAVGALQQVWVRPPLARRPPAVPVSPVGADSGLHVS